jgi:hypothetical protein
MKLIRINIMAGLVFLSAIVTGCGTHEQKTEDLVKFNKLKWMQNIWRGNQGNAKLYESWHKKNFRLMDGISYTTDKNGRRVYSQEMRIEQNNNQIYYILKLPGNEQETLKLTSVNNKSVVFKNQDAGYPQTIVYKHPEADSMVVYLAGVSEGTKMKTRFQYQKD